MPRTLESFISATSPMPTGEVSLIRDLFDHSPGFMAILSGPDHVFVFANQAYMGLVGQRPLIGLPVTTALPEVLSQGFKALLDEVFTTGQRYEANAAEVQLEREHGRPLVTAFVDFVYQPIRDTAGAITGILVQGHDVTVFKQATIQLQESRRHLQTALSANQSIFDYSLDIITTIDAEGRFTKVSRNAEEVWGYSADELTGRRYIDFVHPDDVEATNAVAAEIMSGRATKAFFNRYRHRDGAVIPVMWSAVWSDEHATMFAVARDMREHQEVEGKLRQAQRMEAIGQLTGGVAHDFNNLLTVILGNAELLEEGLADVGELSRLATMTRVAAEQGAELTSRLLSFSRRQPLEPKAADVNGLIDSMHGLLTRVLGEHVHTRTVCQSNLWRAMIDVPQLENALLNLCINARDAMPDGGDIVIETSNISLDSDYAASQSELTEGDYVLVAVSDTGFGMDAETLARAFEPFFTTKEVGKGSGLGLSMVYGFAKQSKGHVRLYSEVGQGTTVKLFLPRAGEADVAAIEPHAMIAPPRGAERILLVEDDALVRTHASEQLSALGYYVVAVSDGRAALAQIASEPAFDLLFTDIVMPGGMNGRELAELARAQDNRLVVLFTSGYTEEALVHDGRLDPGVHVLPKPYRRVDLAAKVRAVLDTRPPSRGKVLPL